MKKLFLSDVALMAVIILTMTNDGFGNTGPKSMRTPFLRKGRCTVAEQQQHKMSKNQHRNESRPNALRRSPAASAAVSRGQQSKIYLIIRKKTSNLFLFKSFAISSLNVYSILSHVVLMLFSCLAPLLLHSCSTLAPIPEYEMSIRKSGLRIAQEMSKN